MPSNPVMYRLLFNLLIFPLPLLKHDYYSTNSKVKSSILTKSPPLAPRSRRASSTPKFETLAEKEQASKVYTFKEDEPAFKITRDSDATWVLSGEKLERLFKMTNFNHDHLLVDVSTLCSAFLIQS